MGHGPQAGDRGISSTPDLVIVALLAEASSNRGTFLLNDGALVCDGLGGADVANKLLDCDVAIHCQRIHVHLELCSL